MIDRFPDIAQPSERAAVLYTMYKILRWQCASLGPTILDPASEGLPEGNVKEEEDDPFADVPPWVQPTPLQAQVAHPVWVDYVPWPKMRDLMIQHPGRYPLEQFFVPYGQTLSLNWPHGEEAMWERRSGSGIVRVTANGIGAEVFRPDNAVDDEPEWVLSAAFEAHIRNLRNWSLGPAFATQFPSLMEDVRLEETHR